MNTENMTQDEIYAWGDPRNTSIQVAEAILNIARDEAEALRIWEEPTATEIFHIADFATKNHRFDAEDMQWGVYTLADALKQIEK